MGETLIKKSRLLPLVAIGASVLTMTGCRALGWADSQSFVLGCPPETPSAKLSQPHYTDVPNSPRNTLKIVASCVNETSGVTSSPLEIQAGSKGFEATVKNESENGFTVRYAHDVSTPPVTVESIKLGDPANPTAGIITMEGMYSVEGMDGPTAVSASK
jgi:hypothetical protein